MLSLVPRFLENRRVVAAGGSTKEWAVRFTEMNLREMLPHVDMAVLLCPHRRTQRRPRVSRAPSAGAEGSHDVFVLNSGSIPWSVAVSEVHTRYLLSSSAGFCNPSLLAFWEPATSASLI